MNIDERLKEILIDREAVRLMEPHIYTALDDEPDSAYDKWGGLYEAVACNPLYNRLVWGYMTSEFGRVCEGVLTQGEGWVLDAGCGSLAFTAEAYLLSGDRPVVLSDRSIRMLRNAKKRMLRINGKMPDNMVFLHADAFDLPFTGRSFASVVTMNLLHAIDDAQGLVDRLAGLVADDGNLLLTTLVKTGRLGDYYLHRLAKGGAMAERDIVELESIIAVAGADSRYYLRGNVAFADIGCRIGYFDSIDCRSPVR